MDPLAPPPIEPDILAKIEKSDEEFDKFVGKEFDYEAGKAGLKPRYSPDLMRDARLCYAWDIQRLRGNTKTSPDRPDHFNLCGYLAYWLRRNSPVALWEESKAQRDLNADEQDLRELLFNCGRAYHAFSLGYRVCMFFEQRKENAPARLPRPPDMDYLRTVSYYMKFKNVSPHAMGLIYRSFFWT